MPAISEQELRKQVAQGDLARLYLLAGEEKLLVRREARRLMEKAGGEGVQAFNCQQLAGETPVDSIADAVLAMPFMAGHKCVAVADFNPNDKPAAELAKLHELLDDLPETTTLVLFYPTLDLEQPKDRKGQGKGAKKGKSPWQKLLDKAEKVGAVVRFARREAPELRRDLLERAGRQGCGMSRQAADRLLEYVGRDMHMLRNELEKLCAYTLGRGEKEITPETVEALVHKSLETTVFAMTDAVIEGKPAQAYKLLALLFEQKEDEVGILSTMLIPYMDMFRVKMALESGKTPQDIKAYTPEKRYNDYRVKKAQRSLRYFSTPALKACLDLLLEADLALKGSPLEKRTVLERLVAQLLLAAQKGAA